MGHTDTLRFRGKRLLIIDDKANQLRYYQRRHKEAGFEVATLLAVNGEEAHPEEKSFDGVFRNENEFRAWISTHPIDALLTDQQMIWPNTCSSDSFWGQEATAALLAEKPGTPAIMHSGLYDEIRDVNERAETLATDNEEYKTLGGLCVAAKGDHAAILDAFDAAFQAQRKR